MKKIALTGGIGMGKSTTMWMFNEFGAEVVNADEIAHSLLAPKSGVWKALYERYGDRIMQHGGIVDRAALARIIFSEEGERKFVEEIMHPRVHDEIVKFTAAAEKKGLAFAVIEIPLLFETGWEKAFDFVVVVRCTPKQQIERCVEKFKISREEAEHRIKLQRPIESKIAMADFVIDNDGTMEELRVQVQRLYKQFDKGEFRTK